MKRRDVFTPQFYLITLFFNLFNYFVYVSVKWSVLDLHVGEIHVLPCLSFMIPIQIYKNGTVCNIIDKKEGQQV